MSSKWPPFPIGAKVKCVRQFESGRPAIGDILTVRGYANVPRDKWGVYVYFDEHPLSLSFGSDFFQLVEAPRSEALKVDVGDWRLWQMSLSDNTCRCGAPKPCEYHP